MSTARQRQRTDDDDEELQHASMVAAVAARFNKDEFWRGSGCSTTRNDTARSKSGGSKSEPRRSDWWSS